MRNGLFLVAALCLSGCMAAEAGPDVDVNSANLIDGTPSSNHPEVGIIWVDNGKEWGSDPCTATLIGKNVILTAAHCFGYRTNPTATNVGVFTFRNNTMARNLTGYVSLTKDKDDHVHDIAVAALDGDPIDPATTGVFWSDLGSIYPDNQDEQLENYGFGCGDWKWVEGYPFCTPDADFSVKRAINISYWALALDYTVTTEETKSVIPTINVNGDSGGPVFYRGSYILFLASGSDYDTLDPVTGHYTKGKDYFAVVPQNIAAIADARATLGVL